MAIALDLVDLCPLCKRPTEICQSVENQDNWVVGDPIRCHATTALHEAQQRVTEETNPQHMALLWDVRLRQGVSGG